MFVKVKGKQDLWHVFGETRNVTYSENVDDEDVALESKVSAADHSDTINTGEESQHFLFFTAGGEDHALIFDTVAYLNSNSGEVLETVGELDDERNGSEQVKDQNKYKMGDGLSDLQDFFERVDEEGSDPMKKRLQKLAGFDPIKDRDTQDSNHSVFDPERNEFFQAVQENISFMKRVREFIEEESVLEGSPDSFTSMDELDNWLEGHGVDTEREFENFQDLKNFEAQSASDLNEEQQRRNGDQHSADSEKEDTSRVEFSNRHSGFQPDKN